MPYTKEQLDTMFSELPDDVKDAMTSVDTVEILNEIKEKYKLHIDQVGQLSAEVSLAMIGAASPQRFVSNLEALMGITKETAEAITKDVNEKIFQVVRNTLENLRREEEKGEEKPAEAQPTTTDPYREPI